MSYNNQIFFKMNQQEKPVKLFKTQNFFNQDLVT